ncbi:MAG: DUF72 domain-containing protein [Lonepinella koalarum]|nr:DUF72 domain-containing protein [Lonepinella koalarum]
MNSNSPHIYIGTGGYADTDLIGTLYPQGTKKEDFLAVYSQHYDTLEINSTFHAPLGLKAFEGIVEKAAGRLNFSVKLHQDFSHKFIADKAQAEAFLNALMPLKEQRVLANLFVQFPVQFERTTANRRYLAELCQWFGDYSLAIEFRHSSWHIPVVFDTFIKSPNLIWCNVDYPQHIGLPVFHFFSNRRIAYLRLHGRNSNWWKGQSAAERHDYRYSDEELKALVALLFKRRNEFDKLYLYFENTTKSHSFYNIQTIKSFLLEMGFQIKPEPTYLLGQQSLF